jgi:hypothetical protein
MKNFHLALTNSILAASAAILFTAAPVSAAILGDAGGYGILGGTTVTFSGTGNHVTGNVGVSPGSSITGIVSVAFSPGYGTDNVNAGAAHDALSAAIDYLRSLAVTNTDYSGGVLTGSTLTAGVYDLGSAASWTGEVFLDAGGSNDAVFVFLTDSTLISASSSTVSVTNGDASVYWVVGSSATLGAHSTMVGNILAHTSITVGSDSTVYGRALALNGATGMDGTNIIDITNGAKDGLTQVPEPSAYALIGSSLVLGFAALRRKRARLNVA